MIKTIKEDSHILRIIVLFLWVLCTLWVRPWTGDLRSDPLTYACIAKDMVEHNNWFSPMLDGQPYLNKPPLYFWLVALSFKTLGFSVYAAKLPSLIFATINVLLLYWIVYRFFKDYDLAFFSAFTFETTRWIIRNFATNRPESLLVFSFLLGWLALILIQERNRTGPYLLGISFAIGIMSKIFFALFPSLLFLFYGIVTKKIYQWLRWKHFYYGCLIGIILSLPWFIYFEKLHPGYIFYLIQEQTLNRITEGTDVSKDKLMYLKEFVMYYQPYLIFFLIGFFLLLRKLRIEQYLFIFIAIMLFFLPLQLSEGKSDRYLTLVTPFFSFVTAMGIVHFEKIKKIAKGVTIYGVIPVFIFFWITPVVTTSEKYQVINLAERLSKSDLRDYTDAFSFIRTAEGNKSADIQFIEWSIRPRGQEHRCALYFYLADSYVHWDNETFMRWVKEGNKPVVLITSKRSVKKLPQENVHWVELKRDKYDVLLIGIKK
ncbi:MAG: glycosyltransferase family 39 protein [Nitrospirae bacterium]|nr:glycosyltransferase family 39 protein [Nitrospirota bacterium]